ncbi:MAG: alpha/beta hydrolase, partial [Acinetobacter sp.]
MLASASHKRLYTLTLLSTIILNGCQVVSLKQQAVDVTIANERNSILTQKKLSEASLNVLSMSGKEAKM